MSDDKHHPFIDEKETGRIEAFSDGVFAIAITLLVWNIKVPHLYEQSDNADLLSALFNQWPSYLAYFISFVTILIMWVSHHRLFNYIRRSNDMFLFLNGLLLMFVTFVPFPTALLAEYVRTQYAGLAAAVYAGTYFAIAVVFNILWLYASQGKRLLSKTADPCLVRNITRQYMFGPPLYLVALVLAFLNAFASITACFILAIFFAFTGAISRLLPCDIRQMHETK